MKFGYVIIIVVAIIGLWYLCKFILTRMMLVIELKHCKKKGVIDEYHFATPLSLFSGIRGEKSDLQLLVGNKIVLIKLIGGMRRKIKYEIKSQKDWIVRRFFPLAFPFFIDMEGIIKKDIRCKFDLEKEKLLLQTNLRNEQSDLDIEVAYLFSPVPLSVKEMAHKHEQELYGGDMCHGARILTKKTLGTTYMNSK